MALRLFMTDINSVSLDRVNEISPQRAKRVKNYAFEADKRRCIAAGLFIEKFLSGKTITENEHGKPVCSGAYFNISHSGDYVIFALSDCEVGCDIERFRALDALGLGKVVFGKGEMSALKASRDRLYTFFSYWTRKEALLKCIGEGFHRPAKTVDVTSGRFCDEGVWYYTKQYDFSDYTVSLCSVRNSFPKCVEFTKL